MSMSPVTLAIISDSKITDSKYTNLYQVLETFKQELDETVIESLFDFNKKALDRMLLEQPGHLQYYGMLAAELRSGIRYFEVLLDEKKGEIWTRLTEKHTRELSQTDKANYVNNDTEYLKLKRPYLAVRELSESFDVIVKALEAQGFALSTHFRSKSSNE